MSENKTILNQQILRVKFNVKKPVKVVEFVAAFTAISEEFEKFMREQGRDTNDTRPTLHVSRITEGSIVADMGAYISGALPLVLNTLENANTVADFVEFYGEKLRKIINWNGTSKSDLVKSDFKHAIEQVAAIANEPNSSIEAAAIEVVKGRETSKAYFKFTNREARTISENASAAIKKISEKAHNIHERVLMRFTRSDTSNAEIEKKSGEKVIIEALSEKTRPLIYGSELAEMKIKHEIRENDNNIFKLAFLVDVLVEELNGKPACYRVTNLHQVIAFD